MRKGLKIFSIIACLLLTFSLTSCKLYGKKEYTIDFVSNGGSAVESITLKWNAEIVYPADPTRKGYTFAGWYLDDEIFTRTYTEEKLSENITLYAKWTINQYTYTFDAQGGKFADEAISKTLTQNYNSTFTIENPTKLGYTFVGWFDDLSKQEAYGNKISYQNTTLYAKYTANKYALSFDKNNSDAINVMEDLEVVFAQAYTLPSNTFYRPGFTFKGWALEANGEIAFADGASYTNTIGANQILYAIWEAIDEEVSYVSLGLEVNSKNAKYGTLADLTLEASKTGYVFKGWSNSFTRTSDTQVNSKKLYYVFNEDASIYTLVNVTSFDENEIYYELNPVEEAIVGLNGLTLYACYERVEYTFTFNSNGGSTVADVKRYYGHEIASITNPTKVGYDFAGWYYASDFTGELVSFPVSVDSSKSLYAKWTPYNYEVKFDANGANGTMSNESFVYDSTSKALTANQFTKAGYTFKGWALTSNGEVAHLDGALVQNLSNTKNATVTLYAIWEANTVSYTVKYMTQKLDGSYIENSQEAKQGKVDSLTEAVYKDITGFTKSTDTVTQVTIEPEGTVIELKYTRNSYAVKYMDGETLVASKNVKYEALVGEEPANIAKTGYTYVLKVGTDSYSATLSITSETIVNITYTANEATIVFANCTLENIVSSTDATETLTTPEKTGYTFVGWATTWDSTNSTPGAKVYDDKAQVTVPSTGLNLFAIWEANTYKIRFDLQGATDSQNKFADITCTYDNEYCLPAVSYLTKEGSTFIKWTLGEAKFYDQAEHIKNLSSTKDAIVTLTANFRTNTYPVSFIANGSVYSLSVLEHGSTITVPSVNPTLFGHVFAGWFTDSTYEHEFVLNSTVSGQTNLYAKFNKVQYVIKFMDGSDVLNNDYTYDYLEAVVAPSPTKDGKSFAGWYADAEFKTPVYIQSVAEANATYYAKFIDKVATIFLTAKEGSIITTSTTSYVSGKTGFEAYVKDIYDNVQLLKADKAKIEKVAGNFVSLVTYLVKFAMGMEQYDANYSFVRTSSNLDFIDYVFATMVNMQSLATGMQSLATYCTEKSYTQILVEIGKYQNKQSNDLYDLSLFTLGFSLNQAAITSTLQSYEQYMYTYKTSQDETEKATAKAYADGFFAQVISKFTSQGVSEKVATYALQLIMTDSTLFSNYIAGIAPYFYCLKLLETKLQSTIYSNQTFNAILASIKNYGNYDFIDSEIDKYINKESNKLYDIALFTYILNNYQDNVMQLLTAYDQAVAQQQDGSAYMSQCVSIFTSQGIDPTITQQLIGALAKRDQTLFSQQLINLVPFMLLNNKAITDAKNGSNDLIMAMIGYTAKYYEGKQKVVAAGVPEMLYDCLTTLRPSSEDNYYVDYIHNDAANSNQNNSNQLLMENFLDLEQAEKMYQAYLENAYRPNRSGYYFVEWNSYENDSVTYWYPVWAKVESEVENVQVSAEGTKVTFTWEHARSNFKVVVNYTKATETAAKVNETSLNAGNNVFELSEKSLVVTGLSNGDKVIVSIIAISENSIAQYVTNNFDGSGNISIDAVNLDSKGTKEYEYTYYSTQEMNLSQASDWYYLGTDNQNNRIMYLFPNHEYKFNSTDIVSINVSDSRYASLNNTTIKTNNLLGSFSLTFVYTTESEKANQTILCTVLPLVESIEFGESLSSYESQKVNTSYQDKNIDTYLIGKTHAASVNEYSDIYYVDGDSKYVNGFKLDMVVNVKPNSSNISTLSIEEYPLVYKFYESSNNGESWSDSNNFIYNSDVNAFFTKLDASTELLYKVVVSSDLSENNTALPNAYKSANTINTKEFKFKLNNGINVYTHKSLSEAYSNSQVSSINLHNTIEVQFELSQICYIGSKMFNEYFVNIGNNPLSNGELDLTNIVMKKYDSSNPDYSFGPYVWKKSTNGTGVIQDSEGNWYNYDTNQDGTCIEDADHYVICEATMVENYKSGKFKLNPEFTSSSYLQFEYSKYYKRSSPYERTSSTESLTINGNYFTIDGSKLPYWTHSFLISLGTIANKDGYKVYSSAMSIFRSSCDGTVTYSNMSILSNNISYSDFIKDNVLSQDSVNSVAEWMTRTSGCINAIYGGSEKYTETHFEEGVLKEDFTLKATINVDNVIITNTLIGLWPSNGVECNLNDSIIQGCWANSIYGQTTNTLNITNTIIGKSGGASIHLEDGIVSLRGDTTTVINPIINIDKYSLEHIDNNITGGEQWFVAYSMTSSAIGLKIALENATKYLEPNKTAINPALTNGEYINLRFLSRNVDALNEDYNTITDRQLSFNYDDYCNVYINVTDATYTYEGLVRRDNHDNSFTKDTSFSSASLEKYTKGDTEMYYASSVFSYLYKFIDGAAANAVIGSDNIVFAYVPTYDKPQQ